MLTCRIVIDPSLVDNVNISVTWMINNTSLLNDTNRVSVSPLVPISEIFVSNLTVYPLSISDSANYTCRAGIVPRDGLVSTIASDLVEESTFILVLGTN